VKAGQGGEAYQPWYGTRMEEWVRCPMKSFSFLLLEKLPWPLQSGKEASSAPPHTCPYVENVQILKNPNVCPKLDQNEAGYNDYILFIVKAI
jgi:hypothetical protein